MHPYLTPMHVTLDIVRWNFELSRTIKINSQTKLHIYYALSLPTEIRSREWSNVILIDIMNGR